MRDVSKILSDAELIAIKALLAQNGLGQTSSAPGVFAEYPKILYAPEFVLLQRLIQTHTDPIVRKEAKEKLSKTYVTVRDYESEMDYMQDGWKPDLNELIIELNLANGVRPEQADPRQPHGREGRRASRDLKAQREQELRDIQRRYMELTGRRLADEDFEPAPVVAPPHEEEPLVADTPKKTRSVPAHVAKAARRATASRHASA